MHDDVEEGFEFNLFIPSTPLNQLWKPSKTHQEIDQLARSNFEGNWTLFDNFTPSRTKDRTDKRRIDDKGNNFLLFEWIERMQDCPMNWYRKIVIPRWVNWVRNLRIWNTQLQEKKTSRIGMTCVSPKKGSYFFISMALKFSAFWNRFTKSFQILQNPLLYAKVYENWYPMREKQILRNSSSLEYCLIIWDT